MSLHVDVWSDYVCPWCYLVSTSLEKLQELHGVTVAWKACQRPTRKRGGLEKARADQPEPKATLGTNR